MYRSFLQFLAAFTASATLFTACNKLDTTDIGSGLIPPVDNVNTFDTILEVKAEQNFFNDTTRVNNAEDLPIGFISASNDPVFGKTTANLFVQFKPAFFPYYIGNANDTLTTNGAKLDSIVLCLSYRGFYGDSLANLKLDVRPITGPTDFVDTALYKFNYRPTGIGGVIGSAIVNSKTPLTKVVFPAKRDSVQNQIRIKITDIAFINALYNRDTLPNSPNNSFRNDSLWKVFNRGFAITVDSNYSPGGKTLLYTNLSEATSRIEIHYQKRNNGRLDTVYTSLPFVRIATTTASRSAYANNITRTWAGAEILSSPASDAVYIQAGPGTYAKLNIPALDSGKVSNRIIHRAELILEQIPGNSSIDIAMRAPGYLYIDNIDTGGFFRPIPYDLAPNIPYPIFPGVSNLDFNYFGGFLRSKKDIFGNNIVFYNFNISRYVQGIVTRKERSLPLRLYAPFQLDYSKQLSIFGIEQYRNSIAFGRVKLGAGNNPNYRMRLRLVYSKI